MNVKQLCEGIGLDDRAQQVIERIQMDDKDYRELKLSFYKDRFSFFETVKGKGNYRELFLYLFVRFAVDVYEEYRIREIDDAVYYDTFKDIQIWCLTCKRDYDVYGIEEYHWLQEHVQLRLFRLGRLQFQPLAFDRDLEVDGRKISKDQIVLNVHIPEGEPLELEGVKKSFESARAFFRGITPIFFCHSWLLYPGLSEILKPSSNVLQFQKQFFIYAVDDDSCEAEQRIFNKILSDRSQYEERTNLQRSAKAYLIAGNKLGSGYGIKVMNE